MNIRDIDDNLFRRAKVAAAEQGLTLKQWVCDAMEAALKAKKGGKR